MACYHPLEAWLTSAGYVVFVERARDDIVRSLLLPCGRCIGCRLERSRQWAMRCVHEASLHESNCVVTLTYDSDHLPPDGSLIYRHFQYFIRRLRKVSGVRIRFFMCGEYGDNFGRPHFHACLFGFRPDDLAVLSDSAGKTKLFTSAFLQTLWPYGFLSVGELDYRSSAYIARYCLKKVSGAKSYAVIDPESGEIEKRVPEFTHMSLKPGIGAEWIERFWSDVYPEGMCVVNGKKVKPPKYYDRKFKKTQSDAYALMLKRREDFAKARVADMSPERLAVREEVAIAGASHYKRNLT